MPDVTLTISADDDASPIIDQVLNGLTGINDVVEKQALVLDRVDKYYDKFADRLIKSESAFLTVLTGVNDKLSLINDNLAKQAKAHRVVNKERKKGTDDIGIKEASRMTKGTTEEGKIDIKHLTDAQKGFHKTNLDIDKKAFDERDNLRKEKLKKHIDSIRRGEIEKSAIRKSEREKNKFEKDAEQKYNDEMNDRKRKRELENIRESINDEDNENAAKHRKQRQDTEDSATENMRILKNNADDELRIQQDTINKARAKEERAYEGKIDRRKKKSQKEINLAKNEIGALIDEHKRGYARFKAEDNKYTDTSILEMKQRHQKEINLIDSSDKLKIAKTKQAHAKEMTEHVTHLTERSIENKQMFEEEIARTENHLKDVIRISEYEADRSIANLKKNNKIKEEKQRDHENKIIDTKKYAWKEQMKREEHEWNIQKAELIKRQKQEQNIKRRGRGGMGGKMQGLTAFAGPALVGALGIHKLREVGMAILNTTIKYQGMVFGLQAVEGSAKAAARQLERIVEIAKLPGVELESAIKATVTLRALKLEAGLVERTIKGIGNALATLGKEAELGGVVLALSQIIGKGKVHAEEINQIAERLPLIRGIMLEQFGTANTEVLQKMELGMSEFIERITIGLEGLPKVATQIGTAFKNMKNQWFLFKASLGKLMEPGMMALLDFATKVLDNINQSLSKVTEKRDVKDKQEKKQDDIAGFVKQVLTSKQIRIQQGEDPTYNEQMGDFFGIKAQSNFQGSCLHQVLLFPKMEAQLQERIESGDADAKYIKEKQAEIDELKKAYTKARHR